MNIAPNITNGHLRVLGALAHDAHQVAAAIFAELGDRQVNDVAIVEGVMPRSEEMRARSMSGSADLSQG